MNAEEYILSSSGLGLPEDSEYMREQSHGNGNQAVMNEKVQSLAGSIYEEFESMILRYDTDVVKSLMPLIVNVLESLDLSYTEIQEYEVELELLKEDNEQLVTQYEREKALRKSAESKNIEFEDNFEGERKDLNVKIESLSSIVKMFELKSKNNAEHINRLEEKENEMKREYSKLHDRYTELFKTHIDYMERAKNFLGSEKMEQMHGGSSGARARGMGSALNQLNRSTGPISFGYTELEGGGQGGVLQSLGPSGTSEAPVTTPEHEGTTNLRSELNEGGAKEEGVKPREDESGLSERTIDKAWASKDGQQLQSEELIQDLEMEEAEDIRADPSVGPASPTTPVKMGLSQTKVETRTGNTLYQELSFQDADALGDVDEGADITGGWVHPGEFASAVNDNYFGMGKEVENLITENNELLATKNALNIVKDDLIAKVDELTGEHEILREEIKSLQAVRSRCQTRISELEEEVKKLKEESKGKGTKAEGEEDDVPMAQRKRFTRVEMARVLMERNQYKEKFMELQEAVRWTEIMRASRSENPINKKSSRLGIWKIFGSLFSANDRFEGVDGANGPGGSNKPMIPYVNNMKVSEADKRTDKKNNFSSRNELFDGDSLSSARRNIERKEQYKQVRAHVKKDDGRTQAYGWSLPVNTETHSGQSIVDSGAEKPPSTGGTHSGGGGSSIPVPVPVYCQPLMKKEPGMKIWCAAGVNLTGGRPSSAYSGGDSSDPPPVSEQEAVNLDAIRACNKQLDQIEEELQSLGGGVPGEEGEELSSQIWICTSTQSISKVTVIDANDPVNVIESFHVCSSHLLCIASVPGIKSSDFKYDIQMDNISSLDEKKAQEPDGGGDPKDIDPLCASLRFVSLGPEENENPKSSSNNNNPRIHDEDNNVQETQNDGKEAENSSNNNEEDVDAVHRRFLKDSPGKEDEDDAKEGEAKDDQEENKPEEEKMSSVLPTMWLGSKSGNIYVHSAVSQWKRCIQSIKLKDSVLCILHLKGRVLVALANGTIAIFHRCSDGEWDLRNYHLLDLGKPHFSIRCMTQVHERVWCGYRNKVFVIDPESMSVTQAFDAHPRKESQVRQMACFGDGVWVSIRLDSTLRLYHATNYTHLQDVDIEPYVSKMLGPAKYGFSFVRITSLLISCHRLWMGTGNGVIISVPFVPMEPNSAGGVPHSQGPSSSTAEKKLPGGLVRVYNNNKTTGEASVVSPKKFIPYCSLSQAQLSFHGHREWVKFFVSVPGNDHLESTNLSPSSSVSGEKMLVVSGGEGYIDFRMVDDGSDQDIDSHMMVWQLPKVKFPLSSEALPSDSLSLQSSESVLNSWTEEESLFELGPTPGSGLVTQADTSLEEEEESCADESEDTANTTACENGSQSIPPGGGESLLHNNNLPPDEEVSAGLLLFEENPEATSPSQGYASSSCCSDEPIEDFTQMPFLKTEMDGKEEGGKRVTNSLEEGGESEGSEKEKQHQLLL